jgi:hypothetical protein
LSDGSPDQAVASVFLDGADDVESDLTGAPFWVIGASLVVVDKQGVDDDAGVLRRNAYMSNRRDKKYRIK